MFLHRDVIWNGVDESNSGHRSYVFVFLMRDQDDTNTTAWGVIRFGNCHVKLSIWDQSVIILNMVSTVEMVWDRVSLDIS
jgi:hypothetical protein